MTVSLRQKKSRLLLYAGLSIAAIILLFFTFQWITSWFTFDRIRHYHCSISNFIDQHYTLSIALYWLIYVIDNICSLPLAAVLTIVAGYFYGPYVAFGITIVAATCGATAAFLVSRYLAGRIVQRAYQQKLAYFNTLFEKNGAYFLLAVRLVPAIPFVLVNILAGLTLVPLRTFIWTTTIGMVPVTLLFVFSGAHFCSLRSVSDIFTPGVVALFALLVCILLLPLVFRRKTL